MYSIVRCLSSPIYPAPFLDFPASRLPATLSYGGPCMYLETLLHQMLQNTRMRVACFAALFIAIFGILAIGASLEGPADDTVPSSAVCPIVYQLDQSPSSRGYHYSFFGNGFFI